MNIKFKTERSGTVMEIISNEIMQVDFPNSDAADSHTFYSGPSPHHVDYCGFEPCPPGYCFGPNTRTSYLIHVVFSGKGTYYAGDKIYPVSAGQAFLILPGAVTTYQADYDDPWSYGWIGFSGYQAKELLSQIGFSEEQLVISVSDTAPLHKCIENIMEASRLTYSNELLRISELLRFLAHLTETSTQAKKPQYLYSKSTYAQLAMRYLTNNYTRKLRISNVASYIGIDRSYLTKIFREEYHTSPQEFLVQLRMEKAISLLSQTSESITSIALQIGYPDSLAFSRIFKQRTGQSPSEYRAAVQNQTQDTI